MEKSFTLDQNKNHSELTGNSSEYLWGIDLGGTKIHSAGVYGAAYLIDCSINPILRAIILYTFVNLLNRIQPILFFSSDHKNAKFI